MLKVVIADDEQHVCRLVQMLADWDALGMEVIATAANGLEALELVENLAPDILITDIRMPGCDGLELIEKAKALSPALEIVIISGYAQFEYAQTAIRYGVGGYLLKPINKAALTSTLEKLGEECRKRQSSSVAIESLLTKNQDIMQRRLLEELLQGKQPTAEQLSEEYGFSPAGGLLQIAILKIDTESVRLDSAPVSVIRRKMEEIWESDLLPLCLSGHLHFQRSAGYVILNYEARNKEAVRRALRNCLNQLQAQYSFFGPVEISLAVGGTVDNAGDLSRSMREAQAALSERLIEGSRRLLENAPPPSRLPMQQLLDKFGRLIDHAVDSFSAEECDKAVDMLLEAVDSADGVGGSEITELVLLAGRAFILRIRSGEEAEITSRFEEICEICGSRNRLFESLRRFLRQNIEQMSRQKQEEDIRPIRMAKQYVQQHYAEPITLDDICDLTGFSASYFSTIFKKETGEGFLKYLTHVRIEQAKVLLRDTNLPVAEICERVGYSDLKHFTATFKKTTSLNPGQYRKLYG